MFAVLILSVALSPAHGIDQKKPAASDNKATKHESQQSQSPQSPPSANSSEENKDAAKKDNDRRKEPSYWQKVISPGILPNWILMFVGIIGVIIAVVTLGFIYCQSQDTQHALHWAKHGAKAAGKSADAALKNAQAVIDAERAYILVSLERYGSVWDYQLRVRNCGRTPGIINSYGFGVDGVPIEEKELSPLSHVARKNIGLILTPQPDSTVLDSFEISRYFSPWWDEINAGTRTGIFEVSVMYTDIFDKSREHETVMTYSYKLSTSILVNLHQYNRYT